ncbi:MAG: M56 family metallopeptidase [Planctomycetota bacterium]
MEIGLLAGDTYQWLFCLCQITSLLLGAWVLGWMIQQRYPDVTASIGMVASVVSAVLVVITLAGVPRPFVLSSRIEIATPISEQGDLNLDVANPVAKSGVDFSKRLHQLVTFIDNPTTSNIETVADKTDRYWITINFIIHSILVLTFLGSLVGIFRFLHSSTVIYLLARASIPIKDRDSLEELSQIVSRCPENLGSVAVRQFKDQGSPFVSWLTGNTIFVPESFLSWSENERAASLSHEIGHLVRRDHYFRVVIHFAFCLTWLNPIAWILHRQTVLAQELAADQWAAQLTKSSTAYCRGLSQLALRFDAECRQPFRQPLAISVSVSSNLIRRIIMLRKSTFHHLPFNRIMNRLVTCFACLGCTWIGCWTVSAQSITPQEANASKVVAASHLSPVRTFSQPTAKPWKTIGNQSGYVSVQANRILNHPDLKMFQPIFTGQLDSVLGETSDKRASSSEFGLALDSIDLIQSGLLLSYRHNVELANGHQSQLSIGASTVEVTSARVVDWPGLIKAIDVEKLSDFFPDTIATELGTIQQTWALSARKGFSNVFNTDALGGGVTTKRKEPSKTMRMLWDAVSGGAVTVVYDIVQTGEFPQDYQEEYVFNQANLELTVATETVAWGIDFTPDYEFCQIRFAAVPKADVTIDQFLEKFKAVKNTLLATDEADGFAKHFASQLEKAQVSIVNGEMRNGKMMPSYLLVKGECSADIGKFGLIKNVSAPPRPESNLEIDAEKE